RLIYHKNIKNARCFIEKNEDGGKYFLGGGSGAWGARLRQKSGNSRRPRKQRVSTVQPLAGWPTGCDVLIYCLNHSCIGAAGTAGRTPLDKSVAGAIGCDNRRLGLDLFRTLLQE